MCLGEIVVCGICGIASWDADFVPDAERLESMRDSMAVRGPDDTGTYIGPGIGLGSRRLSIVDLSGRGHMPMASVDGRYLIVHNGEIYNFQELRKRLEAKGHLFHSNTDTEVLLALYAENGPAMLEQLNGMFGFAIWDRRTRSLFLARDRLGVKPVYYAIHDQTFYFGSEEKALFAAGVPREFDSATWEELLLFRYVAGERTPYRGVQKLLPGHYLVWQRGRLEVRRWWDLAEAILARRENADGKAYLQTLADSVRLRLISDVPIGILLSGGLDSSAIAALAARAGTRELGAFTCRFEETQYDEGQLAQSVARRWGLTFHERFVEPKELLAMLRRATWLQDEPLAHSSHVHMLAISELAKTNATVLLSGEGADETLGGYDRYRPLLYSALLPAARALIPNGLRRTHFSRRLGKLKRLLEGGGVQSYVRFNACEVLPEDLDGVGVDLQGDWLYREATLEQARNLYRSPVRQAMYIDQKTFLVSLLDRNDRMTMGASIECRVPFLDYRCVELAGALPSRTLFSGGRGKSLLRRAESRWLPKEVRTGRKWGFGVPWHNYLRGVPELSAIVADLPELEPVKSGPFELRRIRAVADAFLKGEEKLSLLVQALVMMVIWHQTCIEEPRAALRTLPLRKTAKGLLG